MKLKEPNQVTPVNPGMASWWPMGWLWPGKQSPFVSLHAFAYKEKGRSKSVLLSVASGCYDTERISSINYIHESFMYSMTSKGGSCIVQ